MKDKDQVINVVKKWYSYIADLQAMHRSVVVVRDHAGEKILKNSKSSLSQKEFGIISVLLVSNGRMDQPNQQSI